MIDMVLRKNNMSNQTHVVWSNLGFDHLGFHKGCNFVALW